MPRTISNEQGTIANWEGAKGHGGSRAREARPKILDYSEGIQDDDGSSKWGETTQASENTGGGQVEHGTCHLPVRPLRAQRPEQGQSQTETEAVTEAQTTRP